MAHDYQNEHRIAIDAVRQAAALCRRVRSQLSPGVLEKRDRSPVTVADFGAQALVCRQLAEHFPAVPVIGEEDAAALRDEANTAVREQVVAHVQAVVGEASPAGGADVLGWIDHAGASAYSDRFWTLDPIDGTKGFLRNEQYAIALALVVEAQVTVAALACPNLPVEPLNAEQQSDADASGPAGLVFTAVRGQGAFVTPLDGSDTTPRPITVSDTRETAVARFCESVESGHSSHSDSQTIASQLNITRPPLRRDSQAKYATVARGEADIYLRLPTRADYVEKIWDHAAGLLVVTEAGGRVTDIHGSRLDFSHGPTLASNRGVVVTNGHLHDAVLAAIESVGIA